MWELPLWGQFLFILLPSVIIILIIVKLMKIFESVYHGNYIQSFSIIPYMVIAYYIVTWFLDLGSSHAVGFSDGAFQPHDVANTLTESSNYLMAEALPTCMAVILIWGILSILATVSSNYFEEYKQSGANR